MVRESRSARGKVTIKQALRSLRRASGTNSGISIGSTQTGPDIHGAGESQASTQTEFAKSPVRLPFPASEPFHARRGCNSFIVAASQKVDQQTADHRKDASGASLGLGPADLDLSIH